MFFKCNVPIPFKGDFYLSLLIDKINPSNKVKADF